MPPPRRQGGYTCRRQFGYCFRAQREHPYRPSDILDALVPLVLERVGELVPDLVSHHARDANAARLRQRLQARRYVDPVAINVTAPEGPRDTLPRP